MLLDYIENIDYIEQHRVEYNKLRNIVQRKIKTAKKEFVRGTIEDNKHSIKKLWKTLKGLGMGAKTKAQNVNIGLLDEKNEICFEKSFVANKFNTFFCEVASKLVELLPPYQAINKVDLRNFYSKCNVKDNMFKFSVVSEEEICKLLTAINPCKATGQDGISAKFIRDSAQVITESIAYIINLSLAQSKVPNEFKTARVIPLYKKGEKCKEGNYRPVSILPVISKVFEKVVFNQVNVYLTCHDLLYNNQSGFRKHHSTDTALISLCDKIRYDTDGGNVTGVILLDLQKAYDTVNHSILLDKLSVIGMDEKSVEWFESYLRDRSQFVELGGTASSNKNITCGVPQGSILGPLLFLIYNDMCKAIDDTCNLYLYADDSALAVSGKNIIEIEKCLNTNINNISVWLQENRLSLHLGKTECILFGSKGKLNKLPELNIVCNNVKIMNTTCVKYLGANLDCHLSGVSMYESVIKKINNSIKFLYRKMSFYVLKLVKCW